MQVDADPLCPYFNRLLRKNKILRKTKLEFAYDLYFMRDLPTGNCLNRIKDETN
jgi:hypothetical protein